jgi:hypothetical protein
MLPEKIFIFSLDSQLGTRAAAAASPDSPVFGSSCLFRHGSEGA